MSALTRSLPGPIRLKLPATSANLGPGFDAVGLAMGLYLKIEASVGDSSSIIATGRDAEVCARVEESLILTTYRDVVESAGRVAAPLRLALENEIPLGMGCGSSAAALLAGVALANYFGELGWTEQQVLEEACRREGHPDNVAACWAGGMTSSAMVGPHVVTATCGKDLAWKLLLAVPKASLATSKARALLPDTYSKADAVANVQRTALLVSAFALDRGDLLRYAMQDRLHQPYRMEVCPLLSQLLPMIEEDGVLGVALSGAGPSVLLIVDPEANLESLGERIQALTSYKPMELIKTWIAQGYATAE